MKSAGALPLRAVLRWLAQRTSPEPPWRTDAPPPDDFAPTDVHVRAALPPREPPTHAAQGQVERTNEPVTAHARLQRLEDAIHQAELRVDRMRRLTDRLAPGPQKAHAYAQHALECSVALLHELIRARSTLQRQQFASIRATLAESEAQALPPADSTVGPARMDPTHQAAVHNDPPAERKAS